jgi:hypothetical protein
MIFTTGSDVPANITVTGSISGTQCFNDLQTITVAGTPNTFVVAATGHVDLIAGVNILMLPGTNVIQGGYLHGYISTNFCNSMAPSMVSTPENPLGSEEINPPFTQEGPFFKVYPNPTTGDFTLELSDNVSETSMVKVEIYGMRGDRMMNAQFTGEKKHEFSLSGKPTGIYFIRAVSGEASGTSKIIKE